MKFLIGLQVVSFLGLVSARAVAHSDVRNTNVTNRIFTQESLNGDLKVLYRWQPSAEDLTEKFGSERLNLRFRHQKSRLKAADLRAAKLSANDLKATGSKETDSKAASLKATGLREAGLKVTSLREADLREAGLRVTSLKETDLREAGLKATSLREAGLKVTSLKETDSEAASLEAIGLKAAGLEPIGSKAAGLEPSGSKLSGLKALSQLKTNDTRQEPPSGAPNLYNKMMAYFEDHDLAKVSDENDLPEQKSEVYEGEKIESEAGLDLNVEAGLDTTVAPTVLDKVKNRGLNMDIVTKFLRIVESQSLLGDNCSAGTEMNLGDGVVDRYAQERFRLEAEVAVNRANFLTRLWKYASATLLQSEYILYTSVRSMVEFDDDIFAGGNCYDKYAYNNYLLFCPFGYRLPEGPILVKNLAAEYIYLSNTSEWFYRARKSAERVIANFTNFKRGYTVYSLNDSSHGPREEDEILSVSYEDGKWSKPYFDCGGGNIWMLTYTVPFFGYENDSYVFKGTSGIDIDLRRVDIDQCPQRPGSVEMNIFAASDKCKKKTTQCVPIPGLGFRRGSYKCVCKRGFYFPLVSVEHRYYNGTFVEEEYEKLMMDEESMYDDEAMFECFPCPEGCDVCVDDSPCIATLNWVLRTTILILASVISSALPLVAIFTWKYGNRKVVKAASPVLLRIIIIGAFFVYSTIIIMYPRPNVITCTLRVWLREMGFSLSYGALMLKTWRISVIFRVRSAKAIKITDLDLIKRLGFIVGGFAVFLAIRTVVATPHVIVGRTADDLKAFLCSTDWWDHSCTVLEMVFLVWGISLCIVVRKAPSEFNESKFISMAIYNEFLLSVFLNISMIFLQSPANPDLLYIIFFCHSQLTITLLLCLIFGSKAYMVLKGQCKDDEGSVFSPSTTKFKTRPKSQNSTQPAMLSTTSTNRAPTDSSGQRLESDVQDEFKRLYIQLELLKEKNMRLGNRHLAAKINAMQEAANKEEMKAQVEKSKAEKKPTEEKAEENNSSCMHPREVQRSPMEEPPGVIRASASGTVGTPKSSSTSSEEKLHCDQTLGIRDMSGDTDSNGHGVELRPLSPNHVCISCSKLDDGTSGNSLSSQGNAEEGSSDATVKSAQNSPEKHNARHRRNRRHRIVINLDDKSRFTDEITV